MSINIEKLDLVKTLTNISYSLTSNKGEIGSVNSNQRDIEILNESYEEAKKLRRKIQVENQEVYNLEIFLSFYSDNLLKLQKIVSSIKSKFFSKGMVLETTNFRHLEYYLKNLPLFIQKEIANKIYITTDALANIFPFYTTSYINELGINVGKSIENNKLCMIDIFSNIYDNSNMCVFGSSGSGKSFFIKLFILRNYFKGRKQIILDLEDEYTLLCNNLNGEVFFKNKKYNIFQIVTQDINKPNYLSGKIEKISKLLVEVCKLKQEDYSYIFSKIKEVYFKFGINEDINSVYEENSSEVINLNRSLKRNSPTIHDFIAILDDERIKVEIWSKFNSNLMSFNGKSELRLESKLNVLSMKDIINEEYLVDEILNSIMNSLDGKQEVIIYIDELWKYSKNKKIIDKICNMYKTIRKRNASIITITQDITDFFEYNSGYYANSILNNSCFKMLFKTDFVKDELLEKIVQCEEKISNLKIGQTLFIINHNYIKLNIDSNEYERKIIGESNNSIK